MEEQGAPVAHGSAIPPHWRANANDVGYAKEAGGGRMRRSQAGGAVL